MKKILIVDDEPDVVQVIEVRLKAAGYEIQTAENGEVALQKVAQKIPDLIILDIVMPKMDGFAVYKQLRSNKDTSRIPVIVLTARGKMEDTFQVLGVDEFMSKPFDLSKLLVAIERLLNITVSTQAVQPVTPAASAAPVVQVSPVVPAPSTVSGSANPSVQYLWAGHSSELLNKAVAFIKARKGEVIFVESAADVIKKISTLKPKVIILDVYLGESSVEEVVSAIRANAALVKTPIILYSHIDSSTLGGDSLNERVMSIDTAKDNCFSAGASDYAGRLSDKDFEKNLGRLL